MIKAWRHDTLDRRMARIEHAQTVFSPSNVADTFEAALASTRDRGK